MIAEAARVLQAAFRVYSRDAAVYRDNALGWAHEMAKLHRACALHKYVLSMQIAAATCSVAETGSGQTRSL